MIDIIWMPLAIFMFFAGFGLGAWAANIKWSDNAYDYRRIEYRGRLYKVEQV